MHCSIGTPAAPAGVIILFTGFNICGDKMMQQIVHSLILAINRPIGNACYFIKM